MPIQKLSPNFEAPVGVETNNYQYNGIELVEDFGLHVNHALFRTLDPQTGRWWQIDPLVELAPRWTPYRFSFNNPVLYSDPLGLFETRKEAKEYREDHEMSGKINKSWENGKKVFSIESQTQWMQARENGSAETLTVNTSTYRWSESGEVVTATEITPNSNTWQPFTGSSGAIEQDYTLEGLAMPLGKLFSGSKLLKIGGSFADEAAKGGSSKLPTQIHHFATNKNSVWTSKMADIAKQYGLDLNGARNKAAMSHLVRHPNAYHNFVYQNMQRAASEAGGNQAKFLQLFDQYVKQPVLQNPGLLRKSGW